MGEREISSNVLIVSGDRVGSLSVMILSAQAFIFLTGSNLQ